MDSHRARHRRSLVAGLAHVLITENLVDLDFLHTYCVGFDEETMPEDARGKNLSYRDYILGTGYDQVEKTPAWHPPSRKCRKSAS